jgi:hypothetical protein
MSDIKEGVGSKGKTYQVCYPTKATKSGYAYATLMGSQPRPYEGKTVRPEVMQFRRSWPLGINTTH